MSPKHKSRDPDLAGAEKALRRAAKRAREIAAAAGTWLVYCENGRLVKEFPGPEEIPPPRRRSPIMRRTNRPAHRRT